MTAVATPRRLATGMTYTPPSQGESSGWGVHVMLSQRGGTNGLAFIVNGDDGNRDAIRIHAGSDVVKPGVDRPARIEMSPLAEVPLCDYGREVGTVSEWEIGRA